MDALVRRRCLFGTAFALGGVLGAACGVDSGRREADVTGTSDKPTTAKSYQAIGSAAFGTARDAQEPTGLVRNLP